MRNTIRLRRGALGLIAALLIASSACQPSPQGAISKAATPGTPSLATASPSATHPAALPFDLHGIGIEVWHPWYGPEASLIDSQIAEFNRDNEWGITVRARGHTSLTEMYDSVTAALQAKEAPQVAIAMPEHALAWDAEGHVVDLATYVAQSSYGLSADEIHDFADVFWNQDVIDRRQLGIAAERSAHLLLYNQSWARELGFDKPPGTPQEFREQACAAHAALSQDADAVNDARGGWLVRTDGTTFLSWLTAFDGSVLDGAGYRFLSPRNLEATVFLKQLYDDGCAWVAPPTDDPSADFAARQALFGTAPLEELPAVGRAMASTENTDEWTVVAFPGTNRPSLQVYGTSFVLLKSTPAEQLAAWLFVRWILEPEQQEKWVEVTGLFPLRTSMEPALSTYGRSHLQWATAVQLIPYGSGQPQLASWRQVRIMMGDGFGAMFRTNTPAGRVAEILAIMDRTARDLSP